MRGPDLGFALAAPSEDILQDALDRQDEHHRHHSQNGVHSGDVVGCHFGQRNLTARQENLDINLVE